MATSELGRWEPLELAAVVHELTSAPFRWWVSGGHALELHLGRQWREHDDTDVGVARCDLIEVYSWMSNWEMHIAASGRLTRWRGAPLTAERHQNNVWCRHHETEPWTLDLTIGDGTDAEWTYRRNPAVRVSWDAAVLQTANGVPYLAPELQLLFKSTNIRAKDETDAHEVIPQLTADRRTRLRQLLPEGHPWSRLAE